MTATSERIATTETDDTDGWLGEPDEPDYREWDWADANGGGW